MCFAFLAAAWGAAALTCCSAAGVAGFAAAADAAAGTAAAVALAPTWNHNLRDSWIDLNRGFYGR